MTTNHTSRLRSIEVENFKAIRHSGSLRLKPLNVLIGSNGSGKSSLIEAARAYQRVMREGVDTAFADVLGFEHVRNKQLPTIDPWAKKSRAMRIRVVADYAPPLRRSDAMLSINTSEGGNRVFIQAETIASSNSLVFDRRETESTLELAKANPGKSVAREWLGAAPFVDFVDRWQFLLLNPDSMGQPRAQRRGGGRRQLSADGGNLAEYMLDLLLAHPAAFEEVVEAMAFVLPYAAELKPVLANDLERRVYLELVERVETKQYRVPGWLFSTGTLRVLALVALLKDPEPPPVIFIEEIENGLDPRTVGLVVDLMRQATDAGRTQVIATSHSPYLLDLLTLDDLLLCTRQAERGPVFTRPATDAALRAWSEDFSPGRLYTMGRLQRSQAETKAPTGGEAEAPEGGWGSAEDDA